MSSFDPEPRPGGHLRAGAQTGKYGRPTCNVIMFPRILINLFCNFVVVVVVVVVEVQIRKKYYVPKYLTQSGFKPMNSTS